MPGELDGRVALVTGAGRGIGAAVARQLAAAGAAVVVNDLGVALDGSAADERPADQVVAEIRAAGGTAVADGGDVSDFTAAQRMVQGAVDTFGGLDVVVNVAGIVRDRMLWNMTAEEWSAVLRVHLDGTFNTCRHVAAYWRSLGDSRLGRRIVNFTSDSGIYGSTAQPNYSAAKLGIVGLTYSTANALARSGATCNALAPAADTRMTPPREDQDPAAVARRSPDNCARVVRWLAGDDSAWCTGQVIGARGYEVFLYSLPRPTLRLSAEGPWTPAALTAEAEKRFRPEVEDRKFPSWPPADFAPPPGPA
ncbi:SDR family NAD(P)-dependent oxidoreductase [Blastococcus sp. SYSU D00669]